MLLQVSRDLWVRSVVGVRSVLRDSPASRVHKDHEDLRDSKDLRDQRDSLDLPVMQVKKDGLANPARLVIPDDLVSQEILEQVDLKDLQVTTCTFWLMKYLFFKLLMFMYLLFLSKYRQSHVLAKNDNFISDLCLFLWVLSSQTVMHTVNLCSEILAMIVIRASLDRLVVGCLIVTLNF